LGYERRAAFSLAFCDLSNRGRGSYILTSAGRRHPAAHSLRGLGEFTLFITLLAVFLALDAISFVLGSFQLVWVPLVSARFDTFSPPERAP